MGVHNLWETLKPAFEPRISLAKFCADFITDHSRPPRLAIDGSLFLGTSNNGAIPPGHEQSVVARNFLAKLNALILLNITFVVVFDGRHKPEKLRNGSLLLEQEEYENLRDRAFSLDYSENIPVVEHLKLVLQQRRIDVIQAPSEGEAQCAHLQKHGIVDYVLSNDGDTLVFGATGILRNFSRSVSDIARSPTKSAAGNSLNLEEYYVTPVHMARITKMLGYDTWRLIFLVCLRGGDYSTGTKGLGITFASRLALCGTSFGAPKNNPPSSKKGLADCGVLDDVDDFKASNNALPDFTIEFRNCLLADMGHLFFTQSAHLANPSDITRKLKGLEQHLRSQIVEKSSLIFGRRVTVEIPAGIFCQLPLFYSHPLVEKRIYRFYPQSLSFAETTCISNDLQLPPFYGTSIGSTGIVVPRSNSIFGDNDGNCGKLHLKIELNTITKSVSIKNHTFEGKSEKQLRYLSVNSDYNGPIKAIVSRLISQFKISELGDEDPDSPLSGCLALVKHKIVDNTEFLMVKYNVTLLGDLYAQVQQLSSPRKRDASPSSRQRLSTEDHETFDAGWLSDGEDESKPTSDTWKSVWIPRAIVHHFNPNLVSWFESQQALLQRKKLPKRTSPKKTIQRTTLDHFKNFISLPTKRMGNSVDFIDPEMPLPTRNNKAKRLKTNVGKLEPFKLSPPPKNASPPDSTPTLRQSSHNPFLVSKDDKFKVTGKSAGRTETQHDYSIISVGSATEDDEPLCDDSSIIIVDD